jgi:hypothetical protein
MPRSQHTHTKERSEGEPKEDSNFFMFIAFRCLRMFFSLFFYRVDLYDSSMKRVLTLKKTLFLVLARVLYTSLPLRKRATSDDDDDGKGREERSGRRRRKDCESYCDGFTNLIYLRGRKGRKKGTKRRAGIIH